MIKTTITCDRCGVELEPTVRSTGIGISVTSSEHHWNKGISYRNLQFCEYCAKLYLDFIVDIVEMEEGMIQQFLSLEPEVTSRPIARPIDRVINSPGRR